MHVGMVVVHYKSAHLTQEDIDSCDDGEWISDQVINLYFEYLTNEKAKKEIVLMDPASVALMLHRNNAKEVFEIFEPLKLHEAELIWWPINDSKVSGNWARRYIPFFNKLFPDEDEEGTHWALLVYVKSADKFYYFDSSGFEIKNAFKAATKLRCLVDQNKDNNGIKKKSSEVEIVDTPQQNNTWDWGVFVMSITEYLIKLHMQQKLIEVDIWDVDFESHINQRKVTRMRKDLKELISTLK